MDARMRRNQNRTVELVDCRSVGGRSAGRGKLRRLRCRAGSFAFQTCIRRKRTVLTWRLRKRSKSVTGPRGAVPAATASSFMNASKQVGATLRRPTPLGGTPAATRQSLTKSSKPTPCC